MRENSAHAQQFEVKYDAYGAMVYRLAMVYLGCHADAEDVTQEVFVKLLYKAPAFADGEHEKRWLLRVTANLCRDQLKGFWRKRAVALEQDYPMDGRMPSAWLTRWSACRSGIRPPFTFTTTRATL